MTRSAVNEDTTTSATKEDPDIPDVRDEKFYLHPQLHLRLWRERRPFDRPNLSSVPGTNIHCYDGLIIFPQIFLHTCSRSRFRSVFRVPRSQIPDPDRQFLFFVTPPPSVLGVETLKLSTTICPHFGNNPGMRSENSVNFPGSYFQILDPGSYEALRT